MSRPDVRVEIEELVLDGVEPGDPLVEESLRGAIGPALAAQGLEDATTTVTAAASAAVAREASA